MLSVIYSGADSGGSKKRRSTLHLKLPISWFSLIQNPTFFTIIGPLLLPHAWAQTRHWIHCYNNEHWLVSADRKNYKYLKHQNNKIVIMLIVEYDFKCFLQTDQLKGLSPSLWTLVRSAQLLLIKTILSQPMIYLPFRRCSSIVHFILDYKLKSLALLFYHLIACNAT